MLNTDTDLSQYVLRLGDDALVLGHRLSEWCAHAPGLEEDLALANIALDCLGQANLLLSLAGELEGKGRSADDFAYWRDPSDFRNVQLVELPSAGDFARVIARQFLVDAFRLPLFEALAKCRRETLAGIAAKAVKEVSYHLRHSRGWMLRLGDGTEESKRRIQSALNELWPYTEELFREDDLERRLTEQLAIPRASSLNTSWRHVIDQTLREATLDEPVAPRRSSGQGRSGEHTEHLGRMLSEMQSLARLHPGAKW